MTFRPFFAQIVGHEICEVKIDHESDPGGQKPKYSGLLQAISDVQVELASHARTRGGDVQGPVEIQLRERLKALNGKSKNRKVKMAIVSNVARDFLLRFGVDQEDFLDEYACANLNCRNPLGPILLVPLAKFDMGAYDTPSKSKNVSDLTKVDSTKCHTLLQHVTLTHTYHLRLRHPGSSGRIDWAGAFEQLWKERASIGGSGWADQEAMSETLRGSVKNNPAIARLWELLDWGKVSTFFSPW